MSCNKDIDRDQHKLTLPPLQDLSLDPRPTYESPPSIPLEGLGKFEIMFGFYTFLLRFLHHCSDRSASVCRSPFYSAPSKQGWASYANFRSPILPLSIILMIPVYGKSDR